MSPGHAYFYRKMKVALYPVSFAGTCYCIALPFGSILVVVVLCPAFLLVTQHDSTTEAAAASVQNAGRVVASPQRASQVPKDVCLVFE